MTPASMATAKAHAQEVLPLVEDAMRQFSAMPDKPGQQVHCLFAGLYRETTSRWLQPLGDVENPLFPYLVVRRFYDIYARSVPGHLTGEHTQAPMPWRRYHWLAKRLTMRSPITSHLLLISLGVRAHVYHDLSVAIGLAAQDYRDIVGHAVDFPRERPNVIGPISEKAFFVAALDYIDWHRRRQTGWRRLVLMLYAKTLRGLGPFWLRIMEGWRSHAWAAAIQRESPVQLSKFTQMRPDKPHVSRE